MKILCVLYDDPKGGMPKNYPLSDLPKLDKYLEHSVIKNADKCITVSKTISKYYKNRKTTYTC